MKICRLALFLVLSLCFSSGANLVSAEEAPRVGRTIDDFELTDFRGKKVQLSDFDQSKLIVVAFVGTECPLAKLYGPRLQDLATEYADRNVQIIGINANRQDTLTEIGGWANRHEIRFPILKDQRNKVADMFGAVRTPEVFVLDRDRKVRYWGRIDDQYGIGIVNNRPQETWLKDAVEELLAGKPVEVSSVEAVGCHIGRVKEPKPDSPVTYSNQIARILRDHCVECHRAGEIGPFELTGYSEVVGWAEMIREVVNDKRMPPWHADPAHGTFENDISLTPEQIKQIDLWVRNGAPEGDPAELPEPKTYTTGWQLPRTPDDIFKMRKEPFHVAAEGEIKYQYFKVDPKFTEDKYISAAEIIPGNREVVHHILVFAKPPGKRFPLGGGGGEFLVGYVPGSRFKPLPEGFAKLVPKGSELIFQVHYTPIGTEQIDLSQVGFLYAEPDEVSNIVVTQQALNHRIEIPPHARNHEETSKSNAAPTDMQILNLMPHMHLRGKSFSYTLVKPDNSRETLLDVPAYDFNWQTAYRLAEPLDVPKGSYIECVAHYDNSAENLANPDPEKLVKWGDQTDDEMMIGYFDVVVEKELVLGQDPDFKSTPRKRLQSKAAQRLFQQLDANQDEFITEDELKNPNQKRLFNLFDVDQNKKLTPGELETGLLKREKLRN
ncbi:MAG: redoxin domain-containing protein [Planctomycetaceae bacterium]|nr:redoxin domain-containing protein [Planctomycetaceae bacterium]